MLILAPPSPDPAQNGDFSEYFWMENEEEFDRQVLKELEEEALMEQCMQAMSDESSQLDGPAPWNQGEMFNEIPSVPGSELVVAMRGLQVNEMGNGTANGHDQPKLDSKLNHEFKFNPMAKEFIPGMSWHPEANRSSRYPELVDNQPDA